MVSFAIAFRMLVTTGVNQLEFLLIGLAGLLAAWKAFQGNLDLGREVEVDPVLQRIHNASSQEVAERAARWLNRAADRNP